DASAAGCDLLALARRYRTATAEDVAFRLLDLPEPCVITVVEDDEVRQRKSSGPRVKKKLERAEEECNRRVCERGEAHVVRQGGWTVQGWPVLVGGRRRVILRSVVDEDQA